MKKLTVSIFISIYSIINTSAQTMTGTITTQPCNNNGVYSVSVIGLTPPLNYTYYINGTSIVHANINSLTDQLTGFSSSSSGSIYCYADNTVNTVSTFNYYTVPFLVNTSSSPAICPSTNGMLTASTFSGTSGPFTYNWTNMNTSISYMGNNISAPVGTYSLLVTDLTTGCVVLLSDSASNIAQQSNINLTYYSTTANCTNGTASVSVSGGIPPYSYLWNTGANSTSITNLAEGLYTANVTDAQGCVGNNNYGVYVSQAVTININPSITNATCIQTNGSAIAFATGGMPPYSYLWNNGQTNQTLTSATGETYYTVIATDANGCKGNGYAYIGVTTPINVTYSASASSCTMATGSASISISGGTAPYTTTWNTYPMASLSTTISGLSSGLYGFTVTDAIGCVRTGNVNISPVSSINANLSSSNVVCPANIGNIYSSVNGSNPPFTYNWNNGANTAQLNNVPTGYYSCVITDAVGCSVTKSTNLYMTSPIYVGVSSNQASCKYTTDGSAIAIATGGTAPYSYIWSNGQSTPNITGLITGYYYVSVVDANGCHNDNNQAFVGYNSANTSCYCTINGNVYKDINNNCIKDGGETGIQNIMIHCSGIGYTFTDANGNYSFQVPTGTYTLSESVNSNYPLASCQNNAQIQTVNASTGCINIVNFANNVLTLHDLHIITTSYPYSAPIPGNPYYQKIIIENNGTVTEPTIQIGYTTDGQIGSPSPSLFTQQDAINFPNWYSVRSGFNSLTPGTFDEINVTYNTPTNIPLGTTINFYDSTAHMAPITSSWLLDQTPWDNVNNYQPIVIGSFDPNFKEVSPKGIGPQGYIGSKDSVLNYIIHFQNEGTYFAQNISIIDTLDSDLDWSTLRPGYSDHNYIASVSENGIITFKFTNINLAWKSQYGDVMSSAMVAYSIKRKHNLSQGTQFKNKAAIYFDYNTPIITNTTLNTLQDLANSINENTELNNNDVVLYPNPTTNAFQISINAKDLNTKGQIEILDITGKVISIRNISLEIGENTFQENICELPSGIYFVKIKCNNLFVTKKLIVIK